MYLLKLVVGLHTVVTNKYKFSFVETPRKFIIAVMTLCFNKTKPIAMQIIDLIKGELLYVRRPTAMDAN